MEFPEVKNILLPFWEADQSVKGDVTHIILMS